MKRLMKHVLPLTVILTGLTLSVLAGRMFWRAEARSRSPLACQATLYVNASANGANDGSSWDNAYTTLSAALTQAGSCPTVTQIWVASGTYKPAGMNGDRNATFTLRNNLAIYGGFTNGQSSLNQRNTNPATNGTVLSGDLNGDDAGFTNNGENSLHVLTGGGTDSTAILDGFTISGGNANGNNFPNDAGGGMYNNGSSPTLTNVSFSSNSTSFTGGGLYNLNSSPMLTNVSFSGNSARFGGGMYNIMSSSPTLTNVSFSGNSASDTGGGMRNAGSSPTLRNCILWGDSGFEIANDGSSSIPAISYSLVQGSGGSANWHSWIGSDGGNNLDADPLFVASGSGNLRLNPGSPAINVGNNNVANPALPATDLDGNARVIGGTVDMGAYEFGCPAGNPSKLYVNASVSGGLANGETWTDAYPTLTAALARAQICSGTLTQIWVASGTYKPAGMNGDRNATFTLRNNLAIYGGFTSGQSSLNQRNTNPATNGTALSGDLNGNDVGFTNNGENSLHVVTGGGAGSTAILDGFTISGGTANGNGFPNNAGGGMYNNSSSPTLTNVSFSGNSSFVGGGMVNANSSPTLTNVSFSGNSAGDGGGMYNYGSSTTLTNVSFSGNSASRLGGGMFNGNSSPTLTNVSFSGNSARLGGGGMHNDSGSPTLTNVSFSGNSANQGGGMLNTDNFNSSRPTLTNVSFSGNSASFTGGGISNFGSSPTLRNCILWGDSGGEIANDGSSSSIPAISYSLVQGSNGSGMNWNTSFGSDGGNNLDANPLFVAPGSGNQRLKPGSPAINVGNNAVASPALPATDLAGNPRIAGGTVDLGAYESNFALAVTGGNNQSAAVGTAFATALQVTLTEYGQPFNDGQLTFTTPMSGASASLSNNGLVTTNAQGQASVIATANLLLGPYQVTAGATGVNAVAFNLTNTCQTITVTNPVTNTGTANAAFSQTFTQTGGIGTTMFSTVSALPTGLTLSSGGVLSGTPTQTGTFPITVKATDSNGCMGTGTTYTLVIGCQAITVNLPATNTATLGSPFSATFTQSGGIGTTTFSTASILPSGVTLSSAGVLSGTPTQVGIFPITVKATDSNGCLGTASYTLQIVRLNGSITDPLACTGPGGLTTGTVQISNPAAVAQVFTLTTSFTNYAGIPGSCVLTGAVVGATCLVTTGGLNASGSILANTTLTVTYQAQVATVATGTVLTASNVATLGGMQLLPNPLVFSATVNCPATGPGQVIPATAEARDQAAGSLLIYNVYTSGATSGNTQNTRINLTNTHPQLPAFVHLFFVAEGCSIADSYVCLTANQTASFLTSDLDPGTSGYLVAVAVDGIRGCPTNFNYLIGDEYVKFSTGHAANLGAQAFSALAGGLPACDSNSVTALLNFDGVSYNRLPATLALSNVGSRADGNDTLLIVNRIGGNLGIGASTLGSLFGILYDDAENALSFSVAGNCQLRNSITNNFPRTTPRFETFIPAGRTGWLKLFSQTGSVGITGAAINFNANAASSAGAFNQGHNLHGLTLNATNSYTIPVFPPSC